MDAEYLTGCAGCGCDIHVEHLTPNITAYCEKCNASLSEDAMADGFDAGSPPTLEVAPPRADTLVCGSCKDPATIQVQTGQGNVLDLCTPCLAFLRDLAEAAVGSLTMHDVAGSPVDWKALNDPPEDEAEGDDDEG